MFLNTCHLGLLLSNKRIGVLILGASYWSLDFEVGEVEQLQCGSWALTRITMLKGGGLWLTPYLRSTIINLISIRYQLRHVGVFLVCYSYSLTILIKFKQGNLCCISKSMTKHQQKTRLKFGSPLIWL